MSESVEAQVQATDASEKPAVQKAANGDAISTSPNEQPAPQAANGTSTPSETKTEADGDSTPNSAGSAGPPCPPHHVRSSSAPLTLPSAAASATPKSQPNASPKAPFSISRIFSGNTRPPSPTSRPNTLPPKSPEEEERHKKEYESMMAAFRAKEKEEEKKRAEIKRKREQKILENKRIWSEEILPNWAKKRKEKRTKEIWWQGIPSGVRGKVWALAVKNDLHITKDLFQIMLQQAEKLKQANADKVGKMATVNLIPFDLPRTFPALAFYQPGGPSHQAMKEVLEAYVSFRPDIGYVQGMSYLAAVLLLYLDPFPAFVCMANLLNRPCQLIFYRLEMNSIKHYTQVFDWILKENVVDLYNHFQTYNITCEMFLLDWILTLFAKSLPIDVASRIWDVYFLEGDSFLFRAAIGLLRMLRPQIVGREMDSIMKVFTGLSEQTMDEDELFENIRKINITPEQFEELYQKAVDSSPHDQ